jgi:hypothetical protein
MRVFPPLNINAVELCAKAETPLPGLDAYQENLNHETFTTEKR